ncbi:hypothetical protein [Streptomyces sp. NBC_01429]|uniref:hypothetical protein n=1 Tax=Streptomyces sp. NBC_01429 TaxID=2903862 RepID=UPI002E2CB19C|nr:hypothetical protein [Streptomyces sp. NBC_01429]
MDAVVVGAASRPGRPRGEPDQGGGAADALDFAQALFDVLCILMPKSDAFEEREADRSGSYFSTVDWSAMVCSSRPRSFAQQGV